MKISQNFRTSDNQENYSKIPTFGPPTQILDTLVISLLISIAHYVHICILLFYNNYNILYK